MHEQVIAFDFLTHLEYLLNFVMYSWIYLSIIYICNSLNNDTQKNKGKQALFIY